MIELQILDVFPYLHTAVSVQQKCKTYRNLEVGGLYFILRKIISELRSRNYVVCCFDAPSNYSNKLEGYKSNREKDPRIIVQAELLWDILQESGVACYKGFGEADDHVFGCVEAFRNDPNVLKIFINSSDYDLCHNLVDSKIEFATVNSLACNVNWQTFPLILKDKTYDMPIKYNTISAYKTLRFDHSDNIKAFKGSSKSGIDLYKSFVNFLVDNDVNNPEITRNKDLFLSFIKDQGVCDSDYKEIEKRANAIFPKDLTSKVGGYRYSSYDNVNFQKLANYCKVIGDRVDLRTLSMMKVTPYPDNMLSDLVDRINKLGSNFKNGIYQADKSIPLESLNTFSSRINVVKGF